MKRRDRGKRQHGARAAGELAVILFLALSGLLWGCGPPLPSVRTRSPVRQGDFGAAAAAQTKIWTEVCARRRAGSTESRELPAWIQWNEKELRYAPGGEECGTAILKKRRFSLYQGAGEEVDAGKSAARVCIFESRAEWKVSDMLSGDIDGDGRQELLLLVWKRGSYGNHLPFWVERNDEDYSQHIFIYCCEQGELRARWMSSALGIPIRDWSLDERGRLHAVQPDGRESSFQWRGFGLERMEQEEADEGAEQAVKAETDALFGEMPRRNPLLHSGFRNKNSRQLTMIAVGDNLIHAGIYRNACDPETGSYDFSPLYAHVRERIQRYDLAAVNQESIFIGDRSRYSDFPNFGSPEEVGTALAEAGFHIVTGANNHCLDQGMDGINDTLRFWKSHPEICLLGLHETEKDAGEIRYLRKNGICLALFNYTCGLNGRRLPEGEAWRVDLLSEERTLLDALERAEQEADLSVCFLHIGEEYSPEPTEEQKACVRRLVNAGADLIICTHPHVLEPYGELKTEEGNSAVVFYSLGNFIANQTEPETVLGGAASITITKREAETETALNAEAGTAPKNSRTEITAYELLPLVCHWERGNTAAYFLSDYTEALAKRHAVNRHGAALSLEGLWERFGKYRERRALH